jgi:formate hydrogenlyase subunit 3/multisubunit Na+/H+ antiporter MnhD subunit
MIPPVLTLALPLLAALAASVLNWRPTLRMAVILASLGLSAVSMLVQAPDVRLPVLGGAAFVLTPLNRTLLAVLHVLIGTLVLAGWRWRGPALTYALLTFAAAAGSLCFDSAFVSVLLLQVGALTAVLMLVESPTPVPARESGLKASDASDAHAEATSRYLTVTFLAGVLLIVGLVLVEGFQSSAENRRLAQALSAVLILGFGLKLAAPPLHLWLPDLAGRSAPLATGVVVAVLGLPTFGLAARILASFPSLLLAPASSGILVFGACVAIALGTLLLVAQRDLRHVLGLAASYAAGYSLLGLALATPLGLVGGLFHAIAAALALVLMAVSAGAIERATGTGLIVRLAGVARELPFSCAGFLIGTLSLAGLPPFAGFPGFWLLLDGTARRGAGWTAVLLVCAGLAIAFFAVVAQRLLFGSGGREERKPESWEARVTIGVLGGMVLVLGVVPQPLIAALTDAVSHLPLGRARARSPSGTIRGRPASRRPASTCA